MALVAQTERKAISRWAKEALAVAKARGVKLGNPNGAESLRRAGKGGVALRAAVTDNAAAFGGPCASARGDPGSETHIAAGDRGRTDSAWDQDMAERRVASEQRHAAGTTRHDKT